MILKVIWAVDIPANRHDLLCMEGLIKALQIFEGKSKGVTYLMKNHLSRNVMADGVAIPGKSANVQLFVKKGVSEVRPFMVSAILRNIKFTPASLQSFIDYQDKMHQNICRRRTLASIGEGESAFNCK
jgi:phenylalanyl-tRNA synthetase beta chain